MRRIFLFLLFLPFSTWGQKDASVAEEIKTEFLHAYEAHKAYAKDFDALNLKTQKGYNEFYKSFYLTALESYSTFHLLEYKEEALEIKERLLSDLTFKQYVHVPTTDFGKRCISALIAAYQLDGDERFLELAIDLGNRLLPAFDTPTGMPQRLVHLGRRSLKEKLCTPYEVGALVVELGMLSQLTHNPIYYQRAKQAALKLWELRSEDNLLGSRIDVESGKWANRSVNATAGNTGYWEALLKAYLLFGDQELKTVYQKGTKAMKQHILVENENDAYFRYARINKLENNDSLYQYSEISMAGMLALAGESELAEKNYTYCQSKVDSLILSPELKDLKQGKWTRKGFPLHSHQVEAMYKLHAYTGKKRYASDAKIYFNKLKEMCRTENGYSGIRNVFSQRHDGKMPSRLLSEHFKYLYLIFGEHKWPLNKIIFSASGQPLQVMK